MTPQTKKNKIQELINKTKKGCGIDIFGNERPYSCGIEKNSICDNCESRLLALQECLEIVQEKGK